MRWLRYAAADGPRLGLLQGTQVHDLSDLHLDLHDGAAWLRLSASVRADLQTRALLNPGVPLAGLQLLTPLARPGKLVCLGLNYADHAAEGGHKAPEYPAFFMRGATSLLAPGAPLIRPRCSDKLDYEAELAVLIGTPARHRTSDDALACVGGYSIFNDGTLRDYQRKASQWTIGKNFDRTGPFGPWVVSPDELPPGASGLRIQSRLNGQVMQDSNTRLMITSVARAIVLLSECLTLEVGDVIAMGTPAGVGYARTPPVFMKAGDRIEIDIEQIGVLANPIADEA
jgi:2-keto-4-pentenoate hydratase/2-oxohepta-3-ene-1,7-dioic acid hydratase in catechol pathway